MVGDVEAHDHVKEEEAESKPESVVQRDVMALRRSKLVMTDLRRKRRKHRVEVRWP